MPSPILETPALLLLQEPRDAFVQLHLLSPIHGKLLTLFRTGSKNSKVQPDLFDIAQVRLQQPSATQDAFYFVKEYELIHRHSGIGKNYSALYYASLLSKILAINPPVHEPHILVEITQKAFRSWESHTKPEATYLKSLFLLAKNQGYPISQDWRGNLPPQLQKAATETLHQPLIEIQAKKENLEALIESLTNYLIQNTDLIIPKNCRP